MIVNGSLPCPRPHVHRRPVGDPAPPGRGLDTGNEGIDVVPLAQTAVVVPYFYFDLRSSLTVIETNRNMVREERNTDGGYDGDTLAGTHRET